MADSSINVVLTDKVAYIVSLGTHSNSLPTFGTPGIVKLTSKHVPADDKTWIRAFVKTNGTSRHIFTSLSEHTRNGWPRAVYCAPRTMEEENGILICVVFDNEDASTGWSIDVVVSQRDATEYGEPVLYEGA